ncbi:MAG: hypothetical protein JWN89_248 [Parcubacteria group bacterium]|nr:hypothetical protein [Parcubacteria group bacterium]
MSGMPYMLPGEHPCSLCLLIPIPQGGRCQFKDCPHIVVQETPAPDPAARGMKEILGRESGDLSEITPSEWSKLFD